MTILGLKGVFGTNYIEDEIKNLKEANTQLTRLIASMNLFQQISNNRAGRYSGIYDIRLRSDGLRSYDFNTYTDSATYDMHDHSDFNGTVGLGELGCNLNGVEITTRHNDYRLAQPSTSSKAKFGETKEIRFPPVPEDVTKLNNLEDQIKEMKEWYRAFLQGDRTHRDYRNYFKSNLCYLEGAWMQVNDSNFQDPFVSLRHTTPSLDWYEHEATTRYLHNTGSKNGGENIMFMPRVIYDIVNGSTPVYAQFQYRILCQPVPHISPNRLRPFDYLTNRLPYNRTAENHNTRRSVAFQLNSVDSKTFNYTYEGLTYMDKLMERIPGYNRYNDKLHDYSMEGAARHYDNKDNLLNCARYHRIFRGREQGANGNDRYRRGYQDGNIYMACSNRTEIAPITMREGCRYNYKNEKVCKRVHLQRWSYAIPLEIIYTHPINNWNPFKIPINKTGVHPKGRYGGKTLETAYTFASDKANCLLPVGFYSKPSDTNSADTAVGRVVGMIDSGGTLRLTKCSGITANGPPIPDVGKIRYRYPLMTLSIMGDPVYKELMALKDYIMSKEFAVLRENDKKEGTYV